MLTGTNSLAASHQHPSSYRRHKTCSQPLQLLHNIPWGFVQHLALPVPACNSWLSLGYCSSRCVVAAAKKTASSVASKGFGDPSKSPPSKAASRATQKCPCWSGKQYQSCCGHYHAGTLAPTPEALLRSRYSAYSLGLVDYLVTTTHKDNPEHTGDPITYARSLQRVARATEYISLKIVETPEQPPASSSTSSTNSTDDDAFIKFAVEWKSKGESGAPNVARETSHFKRVNNAWLYYGALE